jgi:hypothetical protein
LKEGEWKLQFKIQGAGNFFKPKRKVASPFKVNDLKMARNLKF